jgi:hypothetical protein
LDPTPLPFDADAANRMMDPASRALIPAERGHPPAALLAVRT